MLLGLSIRDVVLIEQLDLEFGAGLSVLTGETGAGKSILLDSLGLALGARGEASLVRRGAERAAVTAEFDVPPRHPARDLIAEQGLAAEGNLILRRIIGGDGRSRAFINDQAIGITLLRQIGDSLVEIQGQHEAHGLLDTATHRGILDSYGGHAKLGHDVRRTYQAWREAREAEAAAREANAAARRDEDYLRHVLAEIDELDPKPGEETDLAAQRAYMMNGAKLAESLQAALAELTEGRTVITALNAAHRLVDRAAEKAGPGSMPPCNRWPRPPSRPARP